MTAPITKIVVVGRDAPLWLSVNVLRTALSAAGVSVTAVELPSALVPADVYASLPPLEALHNQLRITESELLRIVHGCFTLGQNFADRSGSAPAFFHAYGAYGTAIGGRDFFPYWLKARQFGLKVGLEDFSLTASAARHGRMLVPDDESERYGRSDYGYHLPASSYAGSLREAAVRDGVSVHKTTAFAVERDRETGDIEALNLNGQRVEGQLFVDASGSDALLIGEALGVPREDWSRQFPVDRIIVAGASRLGSIPAYADVRAGPSGWTGIYPSLAQTHVVHAFASRLTSDEEALRDAAIIAGLPLSNAEVRTSRPGRRELAWARNCVAIGEATCALDPIHEVQLHAVQLGLIQLLAHFPVGENAHAQRDELNRIARSSFERLRDFQTAHYLLNRYQGPFWSAARDVEISPALAHSIALFQARGEIAPWEDESFSPDSWRALFTGHGLTPDTYSPTVDLMPPDEIKGHFRGMLGFVKEQVLRQPTHDSCLRRFAGIQHG